MHSPSPGQIADSLRAVFEQVRRWRPLTAEDCAKVGELFVHRNVAHWVSHMMPPRGHGKTCAGGCPVDFPKHRRETHIEGPEKPMRENGHDFCSERMRKHPWSLQVSLLWNSDPRRRQSDNAQDSPPSRECALEVYRGIINSPDARANWSAAKSLKRPRSVEEQWNRIMDAVEKAFEQIGDDNRQGCLEEKIADTIDPRLLTGLVRFVSNVLQVMTAHQRRNAKKLCDEAFRAMYLLGRTILIHARAKWVLPTAQHRKAIGAFTDVLKKLGAKDRDQIEAMLEEPYLDANCQKVVMGYMAETVRPHVDTGLPPGDALNNMLVQDLFWDRVGGDFDLYRWCRARYQN